MPNKSKLISAVTSATLAGCFLIGSGCSGVAPSKTASNAGTGAMAGAVGGGIIGHQSGSTYQGAAVGGLVGAAVGGIVGAVQEAKERSEQDRLAQERAYQQELAKRRAQEAKFKAAIEEELAVAEGFRISDQEISQVETKAKDLESQLKALQEQRTAALNRKRSLESAQQRISTAEQEIERLTAELAELRGETAADVGGPTRTHRVTDGENIDSIAARYKVSVASIRAANAGVDLERLIPGQTLKIPVESASAATNTGE